ncbi:Oidioi.mRNA.OKI2018_I69.PAR.g12213.t1.cds [Oikopleura dioica]|uniref:Oidioi.mRNA.OKI2018_I69.PAR.g12213.t1.cds n=1 Tax=Oikopleura dioica TaxID=34765 RepID=A0ABN7S2W8_OIKDI|nr:Oidioi.mRNA.OKI2018_I69.PAR.g12213.t1.cds [Oikopleura dioica]
MRTISILNPIEISIESFEIDSKDVAWYKIIIKTSDRTWSVLKRYSEFDSLHSNIKSKIKGVKIPPKKIRKSEDFLQSRKNELEKYLNEVIEEVSETVPMDLVTFLKLDSFEPYSIVSELALTLQKKKSTLLSSLQLNALSFLSADSPLYQEVVQQFSQLKSVKIKGSSKNDLHHSSLSREKLAFSVAYFTAAHELSLHHCYAENISGFDRLKSSLRVLSFEGQSKSISTVLANGDSGPWQMLSRVNFTKSKLQKVDLNMDLCPNLENLNLNGNRLTDIENLETLMKLTILDLSNNGLTAPTFLSLGNISILNISGNQISSLKPIGRLLGLMTLNASKNQVEDIDEATHLNRLPMLTEVDLSDNPIAQKLDYRTQILARVPRRASELIIDGIIPSKEELSMADIFCALRDAESKETTATLNRRNFALETKTIL